MGLRHEWKHEINYMDLLMIRQRLRAVMHPDPHAKDGKYLIRSMYFDNLFDKALREKIDGVNDREKFRIRYYNGDTSFIQLEKKSKKNGLGTKAQERLTEEETLAIIRGDISWMRDSGRDLLTELYARMKGQGISAKTIVDYTREPFVYGPGNVRVTFDYGIRTGISCKDFLNPDCPTIPVPDNPIILEVKWDAYLPEIIRDAVQVPGRRVSSYSKYAASRSYG